ncbi:MAG: hypothetical protein Q9218_003796 [Villophora microphyllina]
MYLLRLIVTTLTYLFTFPIVTFAANTSQPINIGNSTHPIEFFQDITVPDFGIISLWSSTLTPIPTWLRPITPVTTTLLLNLLISTYATRPSEGVATYSTIGPETSPLLSGLTARVVVKQWIASAKYPIPAGPLRNKEIAYAAQLVQSLYTDFGVPKKEWAWEMCYVAGEERKYYKNCTGVIMVQRDLWYVN